MHHIVSVVKQLVTGDYKWQKNQKVFLPQMLHDEAVYTLSPKAFVQT